MSRLYEQALEVCASVPLKWGTMEQKKARAVLALIDAGFLNADETLTEKGRLLTKDTRIMLLGSFLDLFLTDSGNKRIKKKPSLDELDRHGRQNAARSLCWRRPVTR